MALSDYSGYRGSVVTLKVKFCCCSKFIQYECSMALFGLFWIFRLRQSIEECKCELAHRKAILRGILESTPPPGVPDPESVAHPFEEIELQSITRNIAVQTDFDDGPEDLDKIELVGEEECNYNATTTCSIECEREIKAILKKNNHIRRNIAHLKTQSDSENEAIWESLEVTLQRGPNGLGLYIAGGDVGGDVSISRMDDNGSAKYDGRLRIGDILERVNDISVENGPHSFAVDALQRAGQFVKIRVRRPRRLIIVTLYRGASGLGLGIAGGAEDAAGGGIFVSHIYRGSSAHYDGRLKVGDKILAVRDEDGVETSLIEATHAQAVAVLSSAGDRVSLVVLPAAFIAPLNRPKLLPSTRSQATSCSTLHKISEAEEAEEIPRCIRIVTLVRSGSRLGMDIIGGVGGDGPPGTENETCGVFVSNVLADGSAQGLLYQGDKILSVDGLDMSRATHRQAATALKFSADTVTIAAQYLPEHYEIVRAKISAIRSAQKSGHSRPQSPLLVQVHVTPDEDVHRNCPR